MPLSEFLPQRRTKLESNQSKLNSSSDLPSSLPDIEFGELLWENGHIVIQGQSTKSKKSCISTFSSLSTTLQDKESGDAVAPKLTRIGATDYAMEDSAPTGISCRMEPNMQDDGMNPLLNCSIDDYFLKFLSEFPESDSNSIPSGASTVGKGSNSFSQNLIYPNTPYQVVSSKTLPGGSDPGRMNNSQFNQVPQQWPSSGSNSKSGASDLVARICTTNSQNHTWDLLNRKYSRQDLAIPKHPLPPSDASPGVNKFSHFTRPVALLKANLQNVGRLNSSGTLFTATSNFPVECTELEPSGGLKSSSHSHVAPVTAEGEVKSTAQLTQELVSVNHSESLNWKDASQDKNIGLKTNRMPSDLLPGNGSVLTRDLLGTRHEIEKTSEPVITSSAVYSGNAAGVVSNHPKHGIKRKIQEGDDSGYQSENIDDDSTIKKPAMAQGSTTKRSRAAEVHNLSERRRRDRINEKMRALQELIPNCNKVDKASMLDEAIEYLKTLQLQVQMMSVCGGPCMPPLMLPPGMQHLLPSQMAHFPPLDVGTGMSFGMGMLDIYGSPILPVPPLPTPQFPCSSVPGNQDMPRSTGHQMSGIPGQTYLVPMVAPGSPLFPTLVHSARKSYVPEVPGTKAGPVKTAESSLANLEDQQKRNLNSDSNLS